jgi:hypothetical protein
MAVTGGKFDFGPLGVDFLRRIRRGKKEKGSGKNYWRIITGGSAWESNEGLFSILGPFFFL